MILKYTYGLITNWPLSYAKKIGISDDYIMNNSRQDNGRDWVENCFSIKAKKGQRVEVNETFSAESYVGENCKISKVVKFTILCSNKENPLLAEDGIELAKIQIPVPEYATGQKLMLKFHFCGTMFKVYCYLLKEKHLMTEVVINYGN
eukprot:2774_1